MAVNKEMISLYWRIGREILNRQIKLGWGAKVIDNISRDLKKEFPEMKGLSAQNLKYMRKFAEIYNFDEFGQQSVDQIPWGHNIQLMYSINNHQERLWYIQKIIEHGWSRNIMVMQIESDLYRRQGKSINNFQLTLPDYQSDLASNLIKDPYKREFRIRKFEYYSSKMSIFK